MLFWSRKNRLRRAEIRRNRPDSFARLWQEMRANGTLTSLGIAGGFCLATIAVALLREEVVPYRPGQFVPHDLVSRVDFVIKSKDELTKARQEARRNQPRIYRAIEGDPWADLEELLVSLPDETAARKLDELPAPLREMLDSGAVTALQQYRSKPARENYNESVKQYVHALRDTNLIMLPQRQREEDARRGVVVPSVGLMKAEATFAHPPDDALKAKFAERAAANFLLALQPKIVALTAALVKPTHELDEVATAEARNRAAEAVPSTAGDIAYKANQVLVSATDKRILEESDWLLLRAENEQFIRSLDRTAWKGRLGAAGAVVLITAALCVYIARYQRRVVRNHARGVGIAMLLWSMLLLAQLAAIGNSPLLFFGVAPTILVAMILAIAYDQRFALGVSGIHGVLVTVALGQGVGFFLVVWVGVLACCFLLDDIRTRSKLIEVGGLASVAMMLATAAVAALALQPPGLIVKDCLYSGAAGLAVGFVVLGILPFIERAFRITTGIRLLEMADVSHPLLRRLAVEAPGTYNHSLQVATLAESAAEAIGANSLLCRVGSYYHDVGKINKAEYFIENQGGGENRHLNLSPSVSLLIIIGHVKDGIELARAYELPTSLFPFIQQHHGTTLVEYFYNQACTLGRQTDQPAISENQYRYPGPKPKSKEVAVVMLADAAESSCRAMPEPTAGRIETLIHDLALRRLTDGQFDECDLTMRELELIERSLVKTLMGIYHGRIAYPSSAPPVPTTPAIRTA